MEIFEKRGRFCVRINGKLHKFNTLLEAEEFLGYDNKEEEPLDSVVSESKIQMPFSWGSRDSSS